jgi:hypothetical protein
MTLQERRRRATALNGRLRSTRKRLVAALQAMEYDLALTCQLEIDHLEGEIVALRRRSKHDLYPVTRWRAASAARGAYA